MELGEVPVELGVEGRELGAGTGEERLEFPECHLDIIEAGFGDDVELVWGVRGLSFENGAIAFVLWNNVQMSGSSLRLPGGAFIYLNPHTIHRPFFLRRSRSSGEASRPGPESWRDQERKAWYP